MRVGMFDFPRLPEALHSAARTLVSQPDHPDFCEGFVGLFRFFLAFICTQQRVGGYSAGFKGALFRFSLHVLLSIFQNLLSSC